MPTSAQITTRPAPSNQSVKIVDIIGELDESNLNAIETALDALVDDESNKVILLNVNGLKFMSSKIIGYMAAVYNKMNSGGRQMALAGCNSAIQDILSIVGLDQMIPSYPSVDEALKIMRV